MDSLNNWLDLSAVDGIDHKNMVFLHCKIQKAFLKNWLDWSVDGIDHKNIVFLHCKIPKDFLKNWLDWSVDGIDHKNIVFPHCKIPNRFFKELTWLICWWHWSQEYGFSSL